MLLYRPIPLSNLTGKITLLFESYERDRVNALLNDGTKLQAVIQPVSVEVSDKIRGFFYGHVFEWVAGVYEKHVQESVTCDRKEFGKNLLKAIYERESNKYEFFGIDFKVDEKPLSFSRSDSTKRIMRAIDIWTVFFAEKVGETFPQPDKEWKIKR